MKKVKKRFLKEAKKGFLDLILHHSKKTNKQKKLKTKKIYFYII